MVVRKWSRKKMSQRKFEKKKKKKALKNARWGAEGEGEAEKKDIKSKREKTNCDGRALEALLSSSIIESSGQ